LAKQVIGQVMRRVGGSKVRREKSRVPTEEEKKAHVYHSLRRAQIGAKLVGKPKKDADADKI